VREERRVEKITALSLPTTLQSKPYGPHLKKKKSYFAHHDDVAIYSKQKAISKPQNPKYYGTKIANIES
jgi:hypothetical protein